MSPVLLAATRDLLRPVRLDQPTAGSMRTRAALSTVGVAVQGLLRFVIIVLVGRIGGPAVLGVVNSALSTALFLSLLWPTSAGSAASKFVARARGAQDWVQAGAVARQLGLRTGAISLVLAAIGVAGWITFADGDLVGGACVAALVLGFSGYAYTRGLQFGAGQVARATSWDVLSALLGLVGVVVVLAAGVRGTGLLLPMAFGYVLYTAAGWPHGAHGRPERPLRRELDIFVLLGVSGTIVSSGFLQLSMVVARASDSAVQAGHYASALALATPASLLVNSMTLVLFPAMAEARGRGDIAASRRLTDHSMRLVVLVMVGIFGSLVVSSRLLADTIFGAQFADAQRLLPILLIAVLATSLVAVPSSTLIAHSQRGMVINTVGAMFGVATGSVVWLLSAPQHGVWGVAFGYLGGTLVTAAIPVVAVWRRGHQAWTWLLLRVAAGVGLALLLLSIEHRTESAPWVDPAFVVAFLGCWAALSWRDCRALLPPLLRARGTLPNAQTPAT